MELHGGGKSIRRNERGKNLIGVIKRLTKPIWTLR